MAGLLVPPRRRGMEFLDDPAVDPRVVRRSLHDVARSNTLFGGTRAVLTELRPVLRGIRTAGGRATPMSAGAAASFWYPSRRRRSLSM